MLKSGTVERLSVPGPMMSWIPHGSSGGGIFDISRPRYGVNGKTNAIISWQRKKPRARGGGAYPRDPGFRAHPKLRRAVRPF